MSTEIKQPQDGGVCLHKLPMIQAGWRNYSGEKKAAKKLPEGWTSPHAFIFEEQSHPVSAVSVNIHQA